MTFFKRLLFGAAATAALSFTGLSAVEHEIEHHHNDCCTENYDDCCDAPCEVSPYWRICGSVAPLIAKIGSATNGSPLFASLTAGGNSTFYHLSPTWDFGVRGELIARAPCARWALQMRYTWLHETLSDDRSTTVAGTLSGGLAGNTALSVKAESERDFHIVDLLVPFACCNFCDYLSIRPYAGFRYLYLDSSYKEVNSGDNFTALALGGDTSTNNHEHHACGAALGFDFATCRSNTLGLDIGARGRLGMALLSSLTDQHQSIVRLGAITSDTRVLNEHKSYQVYELMIGIDADRCVCGRELNFGVDYEVSKWGREDESTTGAFPTIITQANRDRITIKSFIFHIGYCF